MITPPVKCFWVIDELPNTNRSYAIRSALQAALGDCIVFCSGDVTPRKKFNSKMPPVDPLSADLIELKKRGISKVDIIFVHHTDKGKAVELRRRLSEINVSSGPQILWSGGAVGRTNYSEGVFWWQRVVADSSVSQIWMARVVRWADSGCPQEMPGILLGTSFSSLSTATLLRSELCRLLNELTQQSTIRIDPIARHYSGRWWLGGKPGSNDEAVPTKTAVESYVEEMMQEFGVSGDDPTFTLNQELLSARTSISQSLEILVSEKLGADCKQDTYPILSDTVRERAKILWNNLNKFAELDSLGV